MDVPIENTQIRNQTALYEKYKLVVAGGTILVLSIVSIVLTKQFTRLQTYRSEAQTSISGGSGGISSSPLSQVVPPLEAPQKITVTVNYSNISDTLGYVSITGSRGYIMGQNSGPFDSAFDIIAYDSSGTELSRNKMSIITKQSLDHANTDGRNSSVLGVSTSHSVPSMSLSDKSGPDTLEYDVDIEYDVNIDHIVIVPSEGSTYKAHLDISSLDIDHAILQKQIDSDIFYEYPVSDLSYNTKVSNTNVKQVPLAQSSPYANVLGAQDGPKKIGIVFISDNYQKAEIGKYYALVNQEVNKIYANELYTKFKSRFIINAVENYEDLGCKYWWRNEGGWETVLACGDGSCKEGSQGCSLKKIPGKKTKNIAKQYPSDLVIIVHNIDDKFCRSSGYYSGQISLCSSNTISGNVINHEIGHSLVQLRDEYVYADTGKTTIPENSNCTTDSSCRAWQGIQGGGCFQGCSESNYYRGGDNFLMRDSWNTDRFGPVTYKIGLDYLTGRFGNPDPTPTPSPTPTLIPCNGGCQYGRAGDATCSTGSCNFVDGGGFCRNPQCPDSPSCNCPPPTPTLIPCNGGCQYGKVGDATCSTKSCNYVDGGAFCRNSSCPDKPGCVCR